MGADVISGIVSILVSVVNSLISIILAPISLLISTTMPAVDSFFGSVSAWLVYATTYAGWVINAFGIPTAVISIIALYYGFKFSTSFSVYTVKLGIKWWEALKHDKYNYCSCNFISHCGVLFG